ncbi:MAG: serine hydrolase domain-containing protein, partial [Acidimicrobiales bacterium]
AADAAAPSTTGTPRTTAAPNPTPSVVRTRATLGSGAAGTPQAGPALAAELAGVLEAWLAETGVSGGQAGVLRYGEIQWSGAAGVGGASETLSVGQSFDVASITKTYTAALVFRYAEAGLIDLDAPLPPLAALPGFPYAGVVTPRQLLTHSTGLVNYRATPSYLSHGSSVLTPALALGWAGAEPLQFEPGTAQDYSSSNYLALGLLLEQVTGLEFTQLVRGDILRPARLANTSFMPPNANSPNSSTAGVMTTVDDLLRWGVLALRDHVLISDAAFAQMTTIEESTAMGGGVMGYCPCTRKRGRPVWRAIGHGGANTELQYSTADDLVVAVNLNAGIWDRLDEVHELVERLRRTVAAYG